MKKNHCIQTEQLQRSYEHRHSSWMLWSCLKLGTPQICMLLTLVSAANSELSIESHWFEQLHAEMLTQNLQ